MKSTKLYILISLVSTALLLSACGGSPKQVEEPAPAAAAVEPAAAAAPVAAPASTSNSTVGQKLIDLNDARKAGAITDEEYETAKKQLLQTN